MHHCVLSHRTLTHKVAITFLLQPYPRPHFLEVHAEGPAAVRVVAALAGGPAGQSPQPQHPDSSGSKEAPSAAEAAGLSNGDVHNSAAAAGSEAALAAEEAQPASELSSRDMGNRATPVHYFVMGPGATWHSTSAWPPPELAAEPYKVFLGSGCAPASPLALLGLHAVQVQGLGVPCYLQHRSASCADCSAGLE